MKFDIGVRTLQVLRENTIFAHAQIIFNYISQLKIKIQHSKSFYNSKTGVYLFSNIILLRFA